TQVRVEGPFAPGGTPVQVACEIPALSGSLELSQTFPADLEQLAVVAKKLGAMRLASPQIANQRDMTAQGETFIAATGGPVRAGQPIVLSIDDLPHHNAAPRWIALCLASAIIGAGVWAAGRRDDQTRHAAERKRLIGRREKLFGELVRLERQRRNGAGNDTGVAARREELITALEHVYGALDTDDAAPPPAARARAAVPAGGPGTP